MSRKAPRKKSDFFNGGRGVELSDYCSRMSLRGSLDSPEALESEKDVYNYPPYDEPSSSSVSSSGCHPNQYTTPSPPSCSPLPGVTFSPSPPPLSSPYNSLEMPGQSTQDRYGDLYNSPPSPVPGQPSSCHPPHFVQKLASHMTYNPGIQNAFPVQPVFAEYPHGGYIGPGPYPSLGNASSNGMSTYDMHYDCSVPRDDLQDNDNNSGLSKKKKRQQKCSLCSNHNVQVDVKGHKWFCPYRNCPCERCRITKGRQHHMKEQQKLTRSLQRDLQ